MTKTDIANLALSKIGESLIDDITDTGDRRARLASLHYEPALREILRAHFWLFAMGVKALVETAQDLIDVTGAGLVPDVSGRLIPYGTLNRKIAWSSSGSEPGITFTGRHLYWQLNPDQWRLVKVTGGTVNSGEEFIGLEDTDSPVDATFSGGASATGEPLLALPIPPQMLGWSRAYQLPADFIKLRGVLDAAGGKIEEFEMRRIDGSRCLATRDYDAVSIDYVQFLDDPAEFDPLFSAAFVTLLAARLARAISGSEKAEADLLGLYQSVDLPAARTADGHDTQSAENHPLREFLDGTLTPGRGDFFPND